MIEFTDAYRGLHRTLPPGIPVIDCRPTWMQRNRGPGIEPDPLPPDVDEPEPADTFLAAPYNIALFAPDGGSEQFGPYAFSAGRTVELLVDHDYSRRIGTAELVNTVHGLRFRARLDPCAQRRIGTRRSVSPAYRVSSDAMHGDCRLIRSAKIEEISIVQRGRYWPRTPFDLAKAIEYTWPTT